MRKFIQSRKILISLIVLVGLAFITISCEKQKAPDTQTKVTERKSTATKSIKELKADLEMAKRKANATKSEYDAAQRDLQDIVNELAGRQLLGAQQAFPGAGLGASGEPSGVIKIYNSTFNELATALKPISRSGSHPLYTNVRVCIPWTDICYTDTIKWCNGNYTAHLDNMAFSITTSTINMSGNVKGTFNCIVGLPFNAALSSTGNATYNSSQNSISVTTNPTSVEPCLSVPVIGNVCLGFSVNVAPTFSYSIPVRTAHLFFETSEGTTHVRLTPDTVNLTKHSGYLQIGGNVSIW